MTRNRSNLLLSWSAGLALMTAAPLLAQDDAEPVATVPEDGRILAQEPETLEQKFDSVLLTTRLARLDLSKVYLQQILQMNPTEEDLLALRNAHDMGVFLGLTRLAELNPEASELMNQIIAAVQTKIGDPNYAAGLLTQLSESGRRREEALTELQHLEAYAVPAILTALQDRDADKDALTSALYELGDVAVAPLLGALQSPSEEVRSVAIEAVGVIGSPEDALWLYRPAFAENSPPGIRLTARRALANLVYQDANRTDRVSNYGVTERLLKAAVDHLANRFAWSLQYEDQDTLSVWGWDADANTVRETLTSKRLASIHFAEHLARDAAELAPENEQAPVVLLAAKLVRDIEAAGWDQPVPTGPGTAHDLAVEAGSGTCLKVLDLSLEHDIPGSGLGAVTALRLNGSRGIVNASDSNGLLFEALNSSHPRVQFAAAVAILEWEPIAPFRGSSRVVEILGRAILAGGEPASVIIDPNIQRGTGTASLMRELGYDAKLATTGSEGFRIAAERGDIELGVLHPNTVRWDLTQTLENLRADARTKNVPLLVMGPESIRSRFALIEDRYENVIYVSEGSSPLQLQMDLQPVLNQLVPPPMTGAQRDQQAQEAAYWLRKIATTRMSEVFDLSAIEEPLLLATNRPGIERDAIAALSAVGRASVQRRYVEMLTAPSLDPELRRQAAYQLAFHIQRYGNLLSADEISRVSDASEGATDAGLKSAIASVLGTMKPSGENARSLILDAPSPATPVPSKDAI